MTTKGVPTGKTQFSLAYRTETIIPVDISVLTLHVEGVDRDQNVAQLFLILDQSEEKQAQICITTNQQQMRAARHKKVKIREFQTGGLVLKRVIQTIRQKDQGKLQPNWKGPYTIIVWGGK